MSIYEIHEKAEKLLNENNLFGEIESESNSLIITVRDGDWKHEHMRLDSLIIFHLNPIEVSKNVLEQSEDDCYSAEHIYKFE